MARAYVLLGLSAGFLANGPHVKADSDTGNPGYDFARCAAYFYNATNARPMAQYERLYRSGERAFNRASRILGRGEADRVMGDASAEMSAAMGEDWRNFDRIEARFGARCAKLVAAEPD